MQKQLLLFLCLAFFLLVAAVMPVDNTSDRYHSRAELSALQEMMLNPPVDTNLYFATSSHCTGCHSMDFNGIGLVDDDGNDVAMYEDWSSSMMANSAKDPFWRAKVSHESITLPEHAEAIQNTCTKCHAPMGHYTAAFHEELPYTMSDLLADTLGLDGVSCGTCHMLSEDNLGQQFSGQMTFDTLDRVLYGPFPFPYAAPMQVYVDFEPVYSEHISDPGICASCHTLITEPFDLEGNSTGTTFVEQATWHEWLNSSYRIDDITCNRCHMPKLADSVIIASGYNFLDKRFPYSQHELVGGNTFMLQLMKDNRFQLGLLANEAAFDETIAKTYDLLQTFTLSSDLEMIDNQNDTAYFELFLRNEVGHKFPSGYPSRRAFVEFVVVAETGDTLFHSGAYDADYNLANHDPQFEPHHDHISSPEQVQIYEMVTGNVNNEFTTILEQATQSLKDNRLPPQGFRTDHPTYDTVQIVGKAETDTDFNFNPTEGSGTDRVRYAIGLNGYQGEVDVYARVYYQALPRRWLAPMLAEQTPEIDLFRDMYESADHTPVLITEEVLEMQFVQGSTSTYSVLQPLAFSVHPNPSWDGRLFIELDNPHAIRSIRVRDVQGREVPFQQVNDREIWIGGTGMYFIQVQTNRQIGVEKIIIQ